MIMGRLAAIPPTMPIEDGPRSGPYRFLEVPSMLDIFGDRYGS